MGELKWEAPAECPDRAALQGSVERYLGVPMADSGGADKSIGGRVTQTRKGFVAHIEVDGRTRTLPAASSCEEATEAAALVMAIAIDPQAVERTEAARAEQEDPDALVPEPEPAPEPEAPEPEPEAPEPEPEPPLEPEPEPPPRTPRRQPAGLRGAIGVYGGIEYGALPGAAGLVGLGAALLGPGFRVIVEGNVLPQRKLLIGRAEIDFRLWSVAAGGCPSFQLTKQWAVTPCVAVEIGQLIALPRRAIRNTPEDTAALWVAGRAMGRVYWTPIRRLGVFASVELVVPVVRPEFPLEPVGNAHESEVAGFRGTLGVEVQFP